MIFWILCVAVKNEHYAEYHKLEDLELKLGLTYIYSNTDSFEFICKKIANKEEVKLEDMIWKLKNLPNVIPLVTG